MQDTDTGQLSKALGLHRSIPLPLWFALIGCDSTSSFKCQSKRTAYNYWKKCQASVTQVMKNLMENPFTKLDLHSVQALEEFCIQLYGDGAESINEQQKKIICHKN